MTESEQVPFWPLPSRLDFGELARITQDTVQADMTVAETAAGVLLFAAGSMPQESTSPLVDLQMERQRTIAAHAYSETLLTFAHAGHRLKRTSAVDLASEIARLRLYDLADATRKTHPRVLAIFEEGSINSPEDFMNQNLLNLLPQDLRPEAIGIIRAYEHFSLLCKKINHQKVRHFRKPQN